MGLNGAAADPPAPPWELTPPPAPPRNGEGSRGCLSERLRAQLARQVKQGRSRADGQGFRVGEAAGGGGERVDLRARAGADGVQVRERSEKVAATQDGCQERVAGKLLVAQREEIALEEGPPRGAGGAGLPVGLLCPR